MTTVDPLRCFRIHADDGDVLAFAHNATQALALLADHFCEKPQGTESLLDLGRRKGEGSLADALGLGEHENAEDYLHEVAWNAHLEIPEYALPSRAMKTHDEDGNPVLHPALVEEATVLIVAPVSAWSEVIGEYAVVSLLP